MLRTASSLPLHRAFDAGLRPDPFPDRAASLLPGPLAVTRTGLTPASDDELTTRRSATQNHSLSSCPAGRTEGRELARSRRSTVGHGAIGAPRFPAGAVLLHDRGLIGAPFPAPARQSVHAVLPHTAYRRRSPPAFGFSRQSLKGLGATTIPDREISPRWSGDW